MFIIVVEYSYTTPMVYTARDEAEARATIERLQADYKRERRATVYKHTPGCATAGFMSELFTVTFETVAG